MSIGVLNNMVKNDMTIGMPHTVHETNVCEACLAGKQTKKSFSTQTIFRATQALALVYGDLCGPISPPTPANNRYVFVLIDDFSIYMWTILLKEKSEAFDRFKKFKEYVEKQTGSTIKTFRTDRGGEFNSTDFKTFFEENGISRHLTTPYTPQQNGVVERRNRTLMEMTRSILNGLKIPNILWGEAVQHSTYIINRVATKGLDNQTPYESLMRKKPNVEHMRIFGCVAYTKINGPYLKKLEERSRCVINLGTEPGSKAYRLYDPVTRQVVVSRDVVFDEKKTWDWSSFTEETNGEPVSFTLPNDEPVEREDDHEPEQYNNQDHINQEDEEEANENQNETEPQQMVNRYGRTISKPRYLDDYVLLADLEGERL